VSIKNPGQKTHPVAAIIAFSILVLILVAYIYSAKG
jgi:hypothetical protein